MGIPDEPFWAPDDVVTAYRETVARARCREAKARVAGGARRARRRRAGGMGRGVARHRHEGLGGRPADVRARREDGDAPGDGEGARRGRSTTSPGSCRARPTSPATPASSCRRTPASRRPTTPAAARSTTASASTAWARPPSAWPCTAGSCRSPARSSCSSTTCARPCASPALSRAKVVFVFSHDSVGVGEDGPTHQPVEHLATLRAIPDVQVIRPADGNETVAAFRAAVDHDDGPTAIVLVPPGHPGAHRRLGGRARRRRRRPTSPTPRS